MGALCLAVRRRMRHGQRRLVHALHRHAGLPIPVYYHLPTVAFSLFVAILASFVALYVVSRTRMTTFHAIAGSILMGAGIATMHYSGMAAMRLPAMHHYDPLLWVVSVALAVVIAYVGLLLISRYRDQRHGKILKAIVASILGIAIAFGAPQIVAWVRGMFGV